MKGKGPEDILRSQVKVFTDLRQMVLIKRNQHPMSRMSLFLLCVEEEGVNYKVLTGWDWRKWPNGSKRS